MGLMVDAGGDWRTAKTFPWGKVSRVSVTDEGKNRLI